MWFSMRHIIIKLLKIKEKQLESKNKFLTYKKKLFHKAIIKYLSTNFEMLYSEFALLSFTASLLLCFLLEYSLPSNKLSSCIRKMAAFTSAQLSNYRACVSLPVVGGGRGELVGSAERSLLLHFNQTLQVVLMHAKVGE